LVSGVAISSHSCFLNLKSTYNPGSTIKFREGLEVFGFACLLTSPEPLTRNFY
jgi:hypothetical protein